ncbi:MAG: hypothetical protein ACRD1X_22175 [Vicinamibacteria bacterium]
MTSPYRSPPEDKAPGIAALEMEIGQLRRDLATTQSDLDVSRLESRRVRVEAANATARHTKVVAALQTQLSTYATRYGSVDRVESLFQELKQLKHAYAAALEQLTAALAKISEMQRNR